MKCQDIGTPANLEGVNHLANLNYAACVRMESGYCGIRWSQYPNDAVSFTVSGQISMKSTREMIKLRHR